MTKLEQIRTQCLECVEGKPEVRACAMFGCSLWPFRMAINPFSKRKPGGVIAGKQRAAKAGCGLDGALLRSWAGQNLPMHSVPSPDPRQMTLAELAALGCTRPSPAMALREDGIDNDVAVGVRRGRIAARRRPQG